ncbi:MAG TPA: S-layer homology domain-containing protein, partial [Candidatus Obscuribacterales bacterium]
NTEYIIISAILSGTTLYTTASFASSLTSEVGLSKNQLAVPPIEQATGISDLQGKTITALSQPEYITEYPLAEKLRMEVSPPDTLTTEALNTAANQLPLALPVTETGSSSLAKKPAIEAFPVDNVTKEALNTGNKQFPASNPLEMLATTASGLQQAEDATPQVVQSTPQLAQNISLSDVQGNWAQSFIMSLAERDIIRGYPDGTFRPNAPVTRAEFAAIISKAFPKSPVREATKFVDVPASSWAYDAIQAADTSGFLGGYPNRRFQPKQNIPRVQVLVALANGLNLSPSNEAINFEDGSQIPEYARTLVAAASANRIVVNYPNVTVLNPNQIATRADVAAFIYQALVNAGAMAPLAASDSTSQYIAGYQPPETQAATPETPTTTPESPATTPESPATATVTSQEIESLQSRIKGLQSLKIQQLYLAVPSISGISPSGFGLSWGQGIVGIGGVNRTRFLKSADAAMAVGVGLGDARKIVGLETLVNIYSLTNNSGKNDAFEVGSVDVKLHRALAPDLAIAAGVENLVYFGEIDTQRSAYGVISKVFRLRPNPANLFSRLYTSVGVGGGRFRSENDIAYNRDSINVFGSLGLLIAQPLSVYADWTGQDLFLGASLAPFREIPLVITSTLQDVTGNAGDGVRLGVSVGYQFSF